MNKFKIIASILLLFLLSCSSKKPQVKSMCNLFKNNLIFADFEKIHIGSCQIDSGYFLAHICDKRTRQNAKLLLFDIYKKKNYGNFEWPAIDKSFYFSCFVYDKNIYKMNKNEYLYKENIDTKLCDTIKLKPNFRFLPNFSVINNVIYSVHNIWGPRAIDINDTTKYFEGDMYRKIYNYQQNTISIPYSNKLNLFSAANPERNVYVLYALNSNLQVKWDKKIYIDNYYNEIETKNIGDYFTINCGNILEIVDKRNGKTIWKKEFSKKVQSVYQITQSQIIVLDYKYDDDALTPTTDLNDYNISKININSLKVEWEKTISIKNKQNILYMDSSLIFSNKLGEIFSFNYNKGELSKSVCTDIIDSEIILDKVSGKNFLLNNNVLYW